MNSATAYDRTPAQVLRFRNRQANPPAAEQERGLFADMADGVIVAQHFCNFAGFEWAETKLFTTIVGLCGDGEKTVEMFDEELGQHARCTDRTIRSWRAAYLKKANTISFWPLDVREGEYDRDRKRYERTAYQVRFAEQLEEAVAAARSTPEYDEDRLGTLERAARDLYDEIPNAPVNPRKKKPKKSLRSPVIQNVQNAAKNLDRGKQALAEMPDRMRAALLAGEGENLRAMLLEMRGQIDGFLSGISQATEGIEVDDIPENSSGIPPGRSEGDEEAEAAEAEVQDRFREDQKNTRKRVDEAEHSPEDIAAMDEIIDRLRKPQVQRVEIPLRSPEEPEDADPPESNNHSGLPDGIRWPVGMSDEEYERQYAEWLRQGEPPFCDPVEVLPANLKRKGSHG